MATDRTLVQIRERTYLEVLDLALVVIRHRPVAIGLAGLAGALPCAALNAWLVARPGFPFILYLAMLVLEAPWATAPLTVVLGGLMFGDRPSAGRVLRDLARAFPSMLLDQGILRALTIVAVVPYAVYPSRLAFLDEVILLERGRSFAAIRRAGKLAGPRAGDLLAYWLGSVFFGVMFGVCFWVGTGAALHTLFGGELTWDTPNWADALGVRFQVGVWMAILFFGVARFLTYIDQRIRMEGWEVELHLRDVGRSLEEAGRW